MFTKLGAADIAQHRATAAHPEYPEFLRGLSIGEGGRVDVGEAGVGRQTVKHRLKAAGAATAVKVKFVRSSVAEVVFEIVGAAEAPKRRRRPPKSAAR